MAAALFHLPTSRVIDTNGIADGATLTFYDTGTLTKRAVYATSALSVEHPNPLTVAAGAAVPDIYLNDAYTYRCIVKNADGGTIDDIDPYTGFSASGVNYALSADDAATLNVREKLTRQVETRDFGDKTRSLANFMLSQPHRVEGYELDAREAGVVADWSNATQTGTDGAGAIQEGMDWLATKGGGILRLPFKGASSGIRLASKLTIPSGVSLVGSDSGGFAAVTMLVADMTTGEAIRIQDRAAGLTNIWLTSSDARWAVSTSATAHGLFLAGPDSATEHLLSEQQVRNVYINRQPGDGVHGIGSFEHSDFTNIWVVSCKRHGGAFDDGTRAGYTNKEYPPFMFTISRFRALDCGGNALLVGHPSAADPVRHIKLIKPQALGCGWNTSAREYEEQIYLRGDDFVVEQPDLEDQQFGNSTLHTTGDTKTSRASPSGGIRFLGNGLKMHGGLASSVKSTLVVESGSTGIDVDISSTKFYTGTWGNPQPVMVSMAGSTITGRFVGRKAANSAVWTKFADIRSTLVDIRVDGSAYLGTTSSSIDTGIYNGASPQDATIASGTLTTTSANVVVRGEGGVADTLATFRYLAGLNGISGHVLRLHYGGEDITISNSGNFLFKDGATSLTLDATYSVATFIYNLSTTKWVEQ